MAVVVVLADVVAAGRPRHRAAVVAGRWPDGPGVGATAVRALPRRRRDEALGPLGLGLLDLGATRARQHQDLADDEVAILEAVRRQDLLLVDLVLPGEPGQRVGRGDLDHEAVDRRDPQRLPDVEAVLRFELVRPPQGHHRDVELVGDGRERVARLDLVRPKQVAAVRYRGIDRDRLEQRPILEERTVDLC